MRKSLIAFFLCSACVSTTSFAVEANPRLAVTIHLTPIDKKDPAVYVLIQDGQISTGMSGTAPAPRTVTSVVDQRDRDGGETISLDDGSKVILASGMRNPNTPAVYFLTKDGQRIAMKIDPNLDIQTLKQ
jgi:hypothetical protein